MATELSAPERKKIAERLEEVGPAESPEVFDSKLRVHGTNLREAKQLRDQLEGIKTELKVVASTEAKTDSGTSTTVAKSGGSTSGQIVDKAAATIDANPYLTSDEKDRQRAFVDYSARGTLDEELSTNTKPDNDRKPGDKSAAAGKNANANAVTDVDGLPLTGTDSVAVKAGLTNPDAAGLDPDANKDGLKDKIGADKKATVRNGASAPADLGSRMGLVAGETVEQPVAEPIAMTAEQKKQDRTVAPSSAPGTVSGFTNSLDTGAGLAYSETDQSRLRREYGAAMREGRGEESFALFA